MRLNLGGRLATVRQPAAPWSRLPRHHWSQEPNQQRFSAPIRLAISELAALGDTLGEAEAQLVLATLYFESAALEEAALSARHARRLARSCGDQLLEAKAEMRLAGVFGEFPGDAQTEIARTKFGEVAAAFSAMGDRITAGAATLNMAISSVELKDFERAFHLAGQARDLFGHSRLRSRAYVMRAICAAKLGWDSVARFELAEAESLTLMSAGAGRRDVDLLYARAVVQHCGGRLIEAQASFIASIERARQLRDSVRLTMYLGELTDVYEQSGDLPSALRTAREQYQAHRATLMADGARRFRFVEMSARMEDERRRSEQLAAGQAQLESAVLRARTELEQAELQLHRERSRRALADLRAAPAPGVEPLTGLPDLAAVSRRIRQLLDAQAPLAIVVITIDDDRIAAPLPDERQRLLQEVAARASAFLDTVPHAFAGSLGSEDLIVVLPGGDGAASALPTVARLHAALADPVDLPEHRGSVAIQCGVALAPEHGGRPNALLSRARLAGQTARQSRPRGAVVALFTNEVEERQRLRNFVREQLPQALADNQISVHYQPVLDARTGLVQSAEALVRWRDPVRGFISPAEFIPLAEETGQVVELGSYVLQQACCEAAGWLADARGHVPDIAVNVSAAQLLGGVLVSQVDAALLLSGLPPHRLAVELTETDLATATDSLSTLQAIRERGVRVKIDDFGTGYSSFGYLTRFPVDCVKIDKSFVDRIVIGESDAAITAAIIAMAHTLKIDVIAEGVEQREQADVLTSQGCDGLQGYLFSKPLAALDFQSWLADRHMAELANMGTS